VRLVDAQSGHSLKKTTLPREAFGEGLVVHGDMLVQLCWKRHLIYEYSLPSLQLKRTVPFNIGAEGWGLATDGTSFYVTDSRAALFVVAPGSYKLIQQLEIFDPKLSQPKKLIYGVNELEWVAGELWGNVYPMYQHKHSECIVRINATTGQVNGWIDMHGLIDKQSAAVRAAPHSYVLNGIAYHEQSGRLYLTGKKWDHMYQIRLRSQPQLGPQHVHSVCNLG